MVSIFDGIVIVPIAGPAGFVQGAEVVSGWGGLTLLCGTKGPCMILTGGVGPPFYRRIFNWFELLFPPARDWIGHRLSIGRHDHLEGWWACQRQVGVVSWSKYRWRGGAQRGGAQRGGAGPGQYSTARCTARC